MRSRAAGPLLLSLLLAGCTAEPPASVVSPPVHGPTDLAAVAGPHVDARATLDALKTFSESFPYRQAGTPMHLMAREWLADAMKAAGLEVVREPFPSTGGVTGENILGIHWGTDRAHWIVLGSHYDVTEGAVFGTYDDGSGTLLNLKLAEAFAKVPTARTVAFIEFDQEERGLIGSKAFVDAVRAKTFTYPVEVVGMVDLDMVGITWPHPAHLVCWENSDEVKAIVELGRKAAGVPDANMEYRKPNGGSSDGASFLTTGTPTVYCWSDWDDVVLKDGTKYAGSYPWWHQADTYETMLAMAGDEATLEAGFQTVLDIVSPTLAREALASTELDVRG